MSGAPFEAPPLGVGGARGLMRLTLETTKAEVEMGNLEIDSLRFFIKSDARRAQILLEQLGCQSAGDRRRGRRVGRAGRAAQACGAEAGRSQRG